MTSLAHADTRSSMPPARISPSIRSATRAPLGPVGTLASGTRAMPGWRSMASLARVKSAMSCSRQRAVSDTVAAPPPARHRLRWAVLAIVLVAEVMDLIDGTIVNVAAPSIRADLGGSATTLQWLGAAYTLAFAVLLITGGRLGDRYGRRRLFMVGIVGFTAASALCAAAPSPEALIALRAVQGAFGALLIPQGFGLIKQVFAEDEITKAFAAFGPVIGLAAVASPVVGGALLD